MGHYIQVALSVLGGVLCGLWLLVLILFGSSLWRALRDHRGGDQS